jgi:hypothetical protein
MDAIRLDEKNAALVTETAKASTGATLYFQRRGNSVVDVVEMADLDDKRRTDTPTAR